MSTPAEPGYRRRTAYHTALLGGVALLASALLVIGDLRTREAIAARRAEDLKASLAQVVPGRLHDNDLPGDVLRLPAGGDGPLTVYRARRGGRVAALAYRIAGAGYAGPIELLLGLEREGRILGVRVLAHQETPGLGDKIEVARSGWIRAFDGLGPADAARPDFAVKKDGGRFDQFTGATITPRAVVAAVRGGLRTFQHHRAALLAPPAEESEP